MGEQPRERSLCWVRALTGGHGRSQLIVLQHHSHRLGLCQGRQLPQFHTHHAATQQQSRRQHVEWHEFPERHRS